MCQSVLNRLRDLIQKDPGQRGLEKDPDHNLINAFPDDFRLACQSIAWHPAPVLAIVTGFFIPSASPPAGETDGPLGALYLARALSPLGIPVALATDAFCTHALHAGRAFCNLSGNVPIITLPSVKQARDMTATAYEQAFEKGIGIEPLTHLIAIERVGPSHVPGAMSREHRDRCYTMRGRDITDWMSPAYLLFETAQQRNRPITIGIGDGGNEIGMGKIPRDVIERNIPRGGLIACRIPTHHLLVCGVSNWGAYALAAGIRCLRNRPMEESLLDPVYERSLLKVMVEEGGLVDGVLGRPSATVDGLAWEEYAEVLTRIGSILE